MREEAQECREELLSELIDEELDPLERRAVAVHVAGCPRCARTLGGLYAARAAVEAPTTVRPRLPKAFWRGVSHRLDGVDGLIRATDLSPQRRPLVQPAYLFAAVLVAGIALFARSYLIPAPSFSDQLQRQHLAGVLRTLPLGPSQPVGYRTPGQFQPVSRNLVRFGQTMATQTVYNVDGLPVSVFRVPLASLDVANLVPVHVGKQSLYLGQYDSCSLAAVLRDGAYEVLIAQAPPELLIRLAIGAPSSAHMDKGL